MITEERRSYWTTIDRLIELAEKQGLTAVEAKELFDIKEEHSWDGLSCSCGGGWMVGHRDGCPENEPPPAIKLAKRVAALNPEVAEIGHGMLRSLVEDARRIVERS